MKKKMFADAAFGFVMGAAVSYLIPVMSLAGISLLGLSEDNLTQVSNIVLNTPLIINYSSLFEFMLWGALIGAVLMVVYGYLRDKFLK